MIGYLRGNVTYVFADFCFLEANGVGWRVFVPNSTLANLKIGEEATLFTHMSVREDAMLLYGFNTRDDYEMFQLLISVSGIGPKVAMGILSSITSQSLCRAIRNKELKTLVALPGVGKKSAERMIVELKDKLRIDGESVNAVEEFSAVPVGDDALSEATAALVALGYTSAELSPILKRIDTSESVETIIKLALKELSRR